MHRRLRRRISHRRMVRWLRTWRWPPDVVATTILLQPPRHGFSCAPSASDQQHSKPLHLLLPVFPSAPCHNIEISIFVRMMRKLKTPSFCLTRHRCRWRGRRRILIGATALDSLLFRSFLFVHLTLAPTHHFAAKCADDLLPQLHVRLKSFHVNESRAAHGADCLSVPRRPAFSREVAAAAAAVVDASAVEGPLVVVRGQVVAPFVEDWPPVAVWALPRVSCRPRCSVPFRPRGVPRVCVVVLFHGVRQCDVDLGVCVLDDASSAEGVSARENDGECVDFRAYMAFARSRVCFRNLFALYVSDGVDVLRPARLARLLSSVCVRGRAGVAEREVALRALLKCMQH